MHVKRLEILADFLETNPTVLARGKFNLHKWMDARDGDGDLSAFHVDQKYGDTQPNECSTVGCGLGWATTIPAFRRAGLRNCRAPRYYDKKSGALFYGYAAGRHFFQLNYPDTEYILFNPQRYPTSQRRNPKYLATRIREMIEIGEEKFNKKHYMVYDISF